MTRFGRLPILALCLAIVPAPAHAHAQAQAPKPAVAFPQDESVLDARRDFGARGDGRTDDTEALQRAIDASCSIEGGHCRALFLPNGVYRVTGTLVVRSGLGPWLYGESRDGVIIRLDDGVKDCKSVLRTHPNEEGATSADWFMRNLRHFTIDVGDNPETDGIRYFATNSGSLQDVRVIGRGKVGINAGFLGQSGPNLIQDVVVEGFETGIQSQWIWGQTISRATIRKCRKQGVYVSANAVGIEDLVVEDTPVALVVDYPNDWTWWGGVVAIVGGRFSGGDPDGPAIRNRNVLYARDVKAVGFAKAIASESPGGDAEGLEVAEYLSHPPKSLFETSGSALKLPIEREPEVAWELDPARWVCANEFGATFDDQQDDTAAIQAAIDAAAREDKSTVYLRGVRRAEPNWYNINGTVRVHGSVRRVLGLGWARVLGGPEGRFIVDDDEAGAPAVAFQNIDSFGGPPVVIENRSKARKMIVQSCGVTIVGDGGGDIFVTDCPAGVELKRPGQRLWARQLNPEGDSDTGLVRNAGGDLWALGVKHEGRGVRFRTGDGARTEILGIFVYGSGIHDESDKRPIFDIDNSSLTVAGLREIVFDAPAYRSKVRERQGDDLRTLDDDREQGWIAWSLFHARPTKDR